MGIFVVAEPPPKLTRRPLSNGRAELQVRFKLGLASLPAGTGHGAPDPHPHPHPRFAGDRGSTPATTPDLPGPGIGSESTGTPIPNRGFRALCGHARTELASTGASRLRWRGALRDPLNRDSHTRQSSETPKPRSKQKKNVSDDPAFAQAQDIQGRGGVLRLPRACGRPR